MKNSVIKQELSPGFVCCWRRIILACRRDNELHIILIGLFIIAAGLGCLETAANPLLR